MSGEWLVFHEGRKDAPHVLLLPGVNCGAWFWLNGLPYLLPQFNVWAFNNPGVDGTVCPMVLSINKIVDLLLAAVEKDIGHDVPLMVVGHSMGGYVAQLVARELGDRVKRLVLVSTSRGQPDTTRDISQMVTHLGQDFWQQEMEVLKDPYEGLKVFFHEDFYTNHEPAYAAYINARNLYWPGKRVTAKHLAAGGQFASMAWVQQLTMPTLVVHGKDDILVTEQSGHGLAQSIPHARYWPVLRCGHFPMLEHENFWPRVIDFLHGDDTVGEDAGQNAQSSVWGW